MGKKMRKTRQILVYMVSLTMLLFAFGEVTVKAEETYYTVTVDATFGQTQARSMLAMINDMRTSDTDAWYWNKDDATKTVFNNGGTSLSALTYDYELEKIAMQRAVEIAVSFEHARPNNSSCFTAYTSGFNNTQRGENIAAGHNSAVSAFEGWCETNYKYGGQGHRRNMLSSGYKSIGIAYVKVNGVSYWVQEFSNKIVDSSAKTANDSLTPTDVEIAASGIVSAEPKTDQTICGMKLNESTAVPVLSIVLEMKESWPRGIPVTTPYGWTIEDTSVARIENNRVVGVKVGTTVMTATALGKTVQIPVSVTNETEHTYDSGVVVKAATCLDKGTMRYTCTGCGDSYEAEIPATGHNWETEFSTIVKEPTCMTSGSGKKRCLNDGCCYFMTCTIPAKGHTFATKTEEGYQITYCTVCDYVKSKVKLSGGSQGGGTGNETDTGGNAAGSDNGGNGNRTETDAEPPVQKGYRFESSSCKAAFRVIEADGEIPAVECVGLTAKGKKASQIKIPQTVKVNGVTCKVTKIAKNAYKGNKKMKQISIPSNVTVLGDGCFENCTALTKVSGGSGVLTVGKKTFKGCTKLKAIEIKSTKLTDIGSSAFQNCKALKVLNLHTTKLKKVGKKALAGTNPKCKIRVPVSKVKEYSALFKNKR